MALNNVKRSTGISDQQLDSKIEEEQFWELAGHLGNYEQYVGVPGFGLNEADKADLKDCARDNGHQHAMVKAFKKWFNIPHNGVITYRLLVDILVKLRKFTLVEAVCEIAIASRLMSRKRGPSEMDPTEMEPSKRTSGQVVSGDQVKSVSQHTASVSIADEIDKFERRFSGLQDAAIEEITDKKISVNMFCRKLMTLPSSIKNQNKDFVMSNFPSFKKAKSIENIFLHLGFYLSYIDFSLLKYIIEQFGSERLKEDMSCYAQDMTQFKARTTISEALPYLPKPMLSDRKNPPEGLSLFTVKFDVNVNVTTLEKLDEYRKSYADEFQLSHLAFMLFGVSESSLLVTWLVPTSLETTIIDKIQEKNVSFFPSKNVLKLSLGGKQLYSLEKEVSQSSVKELTVDTVTAKPHHSSEYSDPDPHRETADKISMFKSLIESTSDFHGLAIIILQGGFKAKSVSKFLSTTCRFLVYDNPIERTLRWSQYVRPTMEMLQDVKMRHRPIVIVVSGRTMREFYMLADSGSIDIEDDIVEPLFSQATPHIADSPKIFLFIARYGSDPSSIQALFPSSGGNYIVGVVSCRNSGYFFRSNDVDSVMPTILRALESSQKSVQEIFKLLSHTINQLPGARMKVIDHLNKPIYLHPDAPQGIHCGPGPTKKLLDVQEEITSTTNIIVID